jgi:hypothetical protein
MNITFGKYRGTPIEEIFQKDAPYLVWVANNFTSTNKKIIEQIAVIKQMIAPYVEEKQAIKQQLDAQRVDALAPAARALKAAVLKKSIKTGYTSAWCMSIITCLEQGDALSSFHAREIVADICGKSVGRRNSKKYIEARSPVDAAFHAALLIQLTPEESLMHTTSSNN